MLVITIFLAILSVPINHDHRDITRLDPADLVYFGRTDVEWSTMTFFKKI
jgi:hypothetical protein